MVDAGRIARHWVEIREESQGDRLVFRPFEAPIPPARGRRSLVLKPGHAAESRSPGPTDRAVGAGGEWEIEGDTLTVTAPGWEGRYRIEELSDDRLVLAKQ